MLVTYMKTSTLETKITSESAYSAPYTLTTTGLNDVIIQKVNKRKRQKQPPGTGFVAKFGADKPVELRFKVKNVRNFRVTKNNATLMCNMDFNIKFVVMA